ncbi:PfkB family carbohydrate kinase [Tistrella bauzanensis]
MARPRGVLVFGSVNLDLVLPCVHLPAAGETVAAADPLHLPGGKGGNQAFAAARAGAATRLAASLGHDAAADAALDGLAQAGCDLSLTVRGTRPTGIAVVAIGPRRAAVDTASGSSAFDNQIIVAAGANADLDDRAVADADLAGMVLVTQNETPLRRWRGCIAAHAPPMPWWSTMPHRPGAGCAAADRGRLAGGE